MPEKEYINRNELIEDFQNDLINLHFDGLKGTPRPKEIKITNVIERIEDFPTADVAPMKHGDWITWAEAGNWIPSENRHECSYCHDVAQVLINGVELLSKYCPNCGARMDGNT